MRKVFLILLISITCCRATRLAAATYYVSKTSTNPSNCTTAQSPGTSALPNIAQGINCLFPGDTLIVQAGTYTSNNDHINKFQSQGAGLNFRDASSSARITIKCEGNRTCIVRPGYGLGPSVTAQQSIVFTGDSSIGEVHYWTIRDFAFDANGTMSACVLAGANIEIINNDIKGAIFQNVSMSGPSLIQANSIHDTYHMPTPNYCGATGGSSSPCGYNIYASHSIGLVIENNIIYNASQWGVHMYPDVNTDGIRNDSSVIRANVFHNNGMDVAAGDIFQYGDSHQIYNNVFYNTTGSAIVGHPSNDNSVWYNNTIYGVSNNGIFLNGANGASTKNNIILNTPATITNSGSGNSYGQNLCDATNAQCQFSSTASTEFVDLSCDTCFHLKSGAVARDKGANLSPFFTKDKDGVTRPPTAAWDIGAYQFTGAPTPTNATPLEDFNYTTGSDLDGRNAGTNWAGPWTQSGTGSITTEVAPSGSFSGGNALRSNSLTGAVLYTRQMQLISTVSVPTALAWQMLMSINNPNTNFNQVSFGNAANPGLANGAIRMASDGHLKACTSGADTDLGAYNANQWYLIEVELDASGHPGQYRVIVNGGTPSTWISMCEITGAVDRLYIVDSSTNTHAFWVDTIGARATMLVFTTQPPAMVTTGVAFSGNVSVTYSNGSTPVPSAVNTITLAVCAGSPPATLSAASGLTKAAVSGTASWTDLVLTQPTGAVGVTLCATTSGGLTPGESSAITINSTAPPVTTLATPARVQARIR